MKKIILLFIVGLLSISLTAQISPCLSTGDDDGDGICNGVDPCPDIPNTGDDNDSDGVLNECDNSPDDYNPDQADIDGDGIGDVSDSCIDPDGDGVCGSADRCPGSDDRVDVDNDGIPDGCDDSIGLHDCDGGNQIGQTCDDRDPCTINDKITDHCTCRGDYMDSDNDGVCDAFDVCEGSDDKADYDNDGVPDACDSGGVCRACPKDDIGRIVICHLPLNPDNLRTIKGYCNEMGRYFGKDGKLLNPGDQCGPCKCEYINDKDSDGDGVCDRKDLCPNNPKKQKPGKCGCEYEDIDTDGDGSCDSVDLCPNSDDRIDFDQDGIPDGCDELEYCEPTADNTLEWISSLIIDQMAVKTQKENSVSVYETPIELQKEKGHVISIISESIDDICELSLKVYMDINNNGIFSDEGEELWSERNSGELVKNFDIDTFELGIYRLRAIVHYGRILGPCQDGIQGEVVDFSVHIIAPRDCEYVSEGFDYGLNNSIEQLNGGKGWSDRWNTTLFGTAQIAVLSQSLGPDDSGGKIGFLNGSGSSTMVERVLQNAIVESKEVVISLLIEQLSGNGALSIDFGGINFGVNAGGSYYLGEEIGEKIEHNRVYRLLVKAIYNDRGSYTVSMWTDSDHNNPESQANMIADIDFSNIDKLNINLVGGTGFIPMIMYLDDIQIGCDSHLSNLTKKKRKEISTAQTNQVHVEKSLALEAIVYPNPSSSTKPNIVINGGTQLNYRSQLFDMTGQVLWEGQLNAGRNSVSADYLIPGIYYLVLHSIEGKVSKKIVVY